MPGTYAPVEELYALADVLGRHHVGVFESASRIGEGERNDPDVPLTRAELAWMGEVSRRSGRPVSFGLTQHDSRPDLYRRVIDFAKEENASGAMVRPQTTARSVGVLYSLDTRSTFDRRPAWRELHQMRNGKKMVAIRDAVLRARLIDEADRIDGVDADRMFVVNQPGGARYDLDPATSLGAEARRRGVSPAAAYIELLLETDGAVVCSYPFLNQRLEAVESMLDDPLVTLGLADAGAHVGQILDASQPTFFLTYWIRERQRWSVEEGIRRLTSDTADLFGISGRGRICPGAYADLNVIDLDGMRLPPPTFEHDFPHGAGRYVQGATGYDCTLVNGQVFMERGEHTGALAGRLLTTPAATRCDRGSRRSVQPASPRRRAARPAGGERGRFGADGADDGHLPALCRRRAGALLRAVHVLPRRAAGRVPARGAPRRRGRVRPQDERHPQRRRPQGRLTAPTAPVSTPGRVGALRPGCRTFRAHGPSVGALRPGCRTFRAHSGRARRVSWRRRRWGCRGRGGTWCRSPGGRRARRPGPSSSPSPPRRPRGP